jgi:hypothetical protein
MPPKRTFRDRLAWLGRMPTHYRILFGSQLVFTGFAFSWRLAAVRKRQNERLLEEELRENPFVAAPSNDDDDDSKNDNTRSVGVPNWMCMHPSLWRVHIPGADHSMCIVSLDLLLATSEKTFSNGDAIKQSEKAICVFEGLLRGNTATRCCFEQ